MESDSTGTAPEAPKRRSVSWSGLVESAGLVGVIATVSSFLGPFSWLLELATHFRVQLAVATALLALALLVARRRITAVLLLLCAVVNGAMVLWVARPIGRSPVPSDARIRLLAVNVQTANRRHDLVNESIRLLNPDIVLLLEVDAGWMQAMAPLRGSYTNVISEAREDNFGIALFSRLPLQHPQVEYLGGVDVPSISATVQPAGRALHLLGTHPVPPGTRQYAAERNLQLEAIRTWAAAHPGTAVILGDLNTTPWSPYFTRLLRDGRLVRAHPDWGVFATWQVPNPLLRLPLDHCLVSPEIAVVHLEVGGEVGSDHRPLVVELAVPVADYRMP